MAGKDVNVKDELIEDEIIYDEDIQPGKPRAAFSFEDFFQKNRNMILGVLGVIVVAAVGIFIYNNNLKSKDKEAQEAIVQAIRYFEADSMNLAINGDGVNPGFEGIIEDYGGTETGNLAQFYLGLAYLQQDNIESAIEHLEKYNTSDNIASSVALSALASAYQEQGEFKKAGSLFEEAASTPERNSKTSPYYLNRAGINYELAGNNDKALSLYREIKKKYPTSQEGQSIDLRIAKLAEEDENF